jgi:IS30 family transposase
VFSKTKNEVCSAIINMLKSVSAKLTLTLDNGGEFADHERVTEKTGINIFSLNLMPAGSGVQTKIPTVD